MSSPTLVRWALGALVAGAAWIAVSPSEAVLRADVTSPTQDTDGDMLPDVVEWACLTNANNPDTDFDGIDDFIEVVQRANPRRVGVPRPADHEMRVVVTSVPQENGPHQVCLHLLFRFMGGTTLLTNLNTWIEMGIAPGVRFSLDSIGNGVSINQRVTQDQGLLLTITVPLASEEVVRYLLPCTIGADATIGSKVIHTMTPLFDMGGTTATLVPYANGAYAIQSIGAAGAFSGGGTNRVCVLQLREWQAVPGGMAYVVTHADCDDCNDLECGSACPLTEGWVFILPGGLGAISGG